MQKTLLIVDDEPDILRSISRLFRDSGYHILTASSGSKGLKLLAKYDVQVIISDQHMPVMTGSAFLSKVKQDHPNIIRIILSSYTDVDIIQNALNDGLIYKFISKPWVDDDFRQHVHEAFHAYATKNKKQEQGQALIRQLYCDKLTGLYNRVNFISQLTLAIEQAKKNHTTLYVISINLDRFGGINRNLSYDAGDLVLQEVAARLLTLFSLENALARTGDDNFTLLVKSHITTEDIQVLLNKIIDVFSLPLLLLDTPLYITPSIGVSQYPQHGELPELLMNCSHLAVLAGKKRGGNRYQFYNDSMIRRVETQQGLETELHQALEQQQFLLYYQPVINATTKKIVSMEALLRWQHPVKGILTPQYFLELCESTGLIIPIGNWVLAQACKQLKTLHAMGHTELSVAVNLSTLQFNDQHLFDSIKNNIEKADLSPHSFIIEITESLSMKDIKANTKLLNNLRELGLQLALDDFGTGYSSLSYLMRLPFNILKIDRTFIQDITCLDSSLTIVQAIVTLAKRLGLTLIVEGVETEAQLALLQSMQCDLIQGYVYSKPIPMNKLIQLLMNEKR